MNVWLRRCLVILTVGGGFIGVALTTDLFSQASKVIAYIMLLAFVCLYGYGIFIGLKLSEGSAPLAHLRFYFGLQIPFISSPIIAYQFCSGLHATVAIIQPGLTWGYRLGSECRFAILSSAPWGIGINFVALAIVFLLYSRLAGLPEDVPFRRYSDD
jgi:hypothetical protein